MKKNNQFLKIIATLIIVAGIILIVAVIAIEAYNYPWGTIFTNEIEQTEMKDPSPIVFKGEDINSVLLDKTEAISNNSFENEKSDEVLPGNVIETSYTPSYLKLGVIKIPKINVSQFILEGTERQLNYGVGHVVGTADLGAQGNIALTGHNSSSFRYLKRLSVDDLIYLETDSDQYTYIVYDSFIVEPDEMWVLDNIEKEKYSLTLITCTSYALETNRLIVRARLVSINDTKVMDKATAD